MVTRATRKSALFPVTCPKLSLLVTIFFRTSQTIYWWWAGVGETLLCTTFIFVSVHSVCPCGTIVCRTEKFAFDACAEDWSSLLSRSLYLWKIPLSCFQLFSN